MKTKDLLRSDSDWCQDAEARDELGQAVAPDAPEAKTWCLIGASQKAYGVGTDDAIQAAYRLIAAMSAEDLRATALSISDRNIDYFVFRILAAWNDHPCRTFDEVRSLIERAGV